MADFILIHGDKAMFLPNFGPAIVVVQPGDLLKPAVPPRSMGRRSVWMGDETKVSVPGALT
jgi:hypothetical protein